MCGVTSTEIVGAAHLDETELDSHQKIVYSLDNGRSTEWHGKLIVLHIVYGKIHKPGARVRWCFFWLGVAEYVLNLGAVLRK